MSLALVAGAGYWGYSLMVRDVSGVPVVRAMDGPIRVQPDDPGGRQAQHQGLAVNQVAAEGEAEDPADQLILAPAPLDLSLEDDVMATNSATSLQAEPAADGLAQTSEETVQLASMEALVEHLQTRRMPVVVQDAAKVQAVRPRLAPEGRRIETAAFANGLARSLRPQVRPANLAYPEGSYAGEADPIEGLIQPGTKLAWLGAYETPEFARREWGRLSTEFSAFFGEKQRVIQQADSGGRTFYRLRAMGFADLADARRFCAVLVAEGAECIPETAR